MRRLRRRRTFTLVGLRPSGEAWAQYLGKGELYEIELHIEYTLKKPVVSSGGALASLIPPRRIFPSETAFPQALLLPFDERKTRRLIEPLIDGLDSNPYWGRDIDHQYTVELAKPGEIKIVAAFLELSPDTDAESACAQIERTLAL
jgi:hypothetical protein